MYTLHRSPVAFNECLITVVITLLCTTTAGFELAIRNSHFAKYFGSLRMSFCIFSTNCELLKPDTSKIFSVISVTSYIVSYFKPTKYPC